MANHITNHVLHAAAIVNVVDVEGAGLPVYYLSLKKMLYFHVDVYLQS